MNVGWGELVVILAIVLLLVGARRLPDIGRSVGEAIREFQRAMRGGGRDGDQPTGKS
jgi:sec-independent protein translocase protein TatA